MSIPSSLHSLPVTERPAIKLGWTKLYAAALSCLSHMFCNQHGQKIVFAKLTFSKLSDSPFWQLARAKPFAATRNLLVHIVTI
jgi:hypothetical protein